jgi:citrate synthase
MTDGLEGVIAAETVLSDVDGAAGRLLIRGYPVETLAAGWRFEQVVHLLFAGFFEDLPAVADIAQSLGRARVEAFGQLDGLDRALLALTDIEAVRALTARLPDGDDLATALRLLAAPAVFAPAVIRARRDLPQVAPDPNAGHAADILRMIKGAAPSHAEAAALESYLVTVCDHGLNASTFAARIVASTRAGLSSAVLAGISALKGPLHGGAPGPVIAMLDAIAAPANAQAWLGAALDRGERLPGFGHRIYRVRDPRADALKRAVRVLGQSSGGDTGRRLAFAETVEQAALTALKARKPERVLETNVEFYTALLLEALAFPPEAFTGVFAIGRAAGWIAHAREQLATGRIIRPQSRYIGPAPLAAA